MPRLHMTATLDAYVRLFNNLRTDRNRSRWPELKEHRAPHKPLLLLAVLDLIEEGAVADNRIELSPELAETFARYWACVPTGRERGKPVLPFFHLRSDGIWHLVARPGKEAVLEHTREASSGAQLNRFVAYARLDDALFTLLTLRGSRQQLRDALIERYFDPPVQARLFLQAAINTQAFAYSEQLLAAGAAGRVREVPPGEDAVAEAVRDQGFRRAVVLAYNRRCALCGISILTAEGHTVVDAAHIIPWSITRDDRPTNGIALCRLCHWAFDEGMLAVTPHYTVLTSPQLALGGNISAHLGTLRGRGILRPALETHLPDLDALEWHRRERFRSR